MAWSLCPIWSDNIDYSQVVCGIDCLSTWSACTIIVRLWSSIFITSANGDLWVAWGAKVEYNSLPSPNRWSGCERFNRTLTDMLAKRVEQCGRDWDAHIPYVLFAYLASLQDLTKESPFFLVWTWSLVANYPWNGQWAAAAAAAAAVAAAAPAAAAPAPAAAAPAPAAAAYLFGYLWGRSTF